MIFPLSMKTKLKSYAASCSLLLLLPLLLAGIGTSQAQTSSVYSDSFNRTGDLNGSAPDTVNLPGQNWIADPGVTTNGSGVFNPDTTTGGYLPVTIGAGHVYTLSADLMSIAQDSSWIAIGFSPTADPGGFLNNFNLTAGPWALIRGDTDVAPDQVFAGPGTADGSDVGPSGSNIGFHHFAIVLDTTNVQWTASWYLDNLQVGSTFTYIDNPTTLSYVGFNADTDYANLGGYIANFSFTEGIPAVPEPATVSLLGISAAIAGTARFIRRRAKR